MSKQHFFVNFHPRSGMLLMIFNSGLFMSEYGIQTCFTVQSLEGLERSISLRDTQTGYKSNIIHRSLEGLDQSKLNLSHNLSTDSCVRNLLLTVNTGTCKSTNSILLYYYMSNVNFISYFPWSLEGHNVWESKISRTAAQSGKQHVLAQSGK